MNDAGCIAFLQWALPRLGLEWPGFRRYRAQVCKRVDRRVRLLGLADLDAYRPYLESHPCEWSALAPLCIVTVSRFHRDRKVFEALASTVLPTLAQAALARGATRLECWCAGCASGEEAYTLAIVWKMALAARFPRLHLRVLGTDIDESLIERARCGCFKSSSLRELPAAWRAEAFSACAGGYRVRDAFRDDVQFEREDLRDESPRRDFDLVLCRNLAFTYFGPTCARLALERIATHLRPGGALVLGLHEGLAAHHGPFEPWPGCRAVFRRLAFHRPEAIRRPGAFPATAVPGAARG